MARNRLLNIFFALILLWLLPGCREKIDIKLSSSAVRLVVDARFTNDTTSHIVKLSRTCDYFDPEIDGIGVSGAEVYITDERGRRIDFTPVDTMPSWYVSAPDVYGSMGETYQLHIWADLHGTGMREHYEAQATMPFMPPIDSAKAVYGYPLPPFGYGKYLGWNLLAYAQDPPTKEYYGFSYAVNGKVYEDSITNMFLFPDNFSAGLYLHGVSMYFFPDPTDEIRDLLKVILHEGDTLTLIGYSFTEGYNDYISQVREALSSNIPVFSAAPSNIVGNVSKGAFGYFAVYSLAKASCTVGKAPEIPGLQLR
ncbi:MAG: DUF4249 domain-containing protein [Bacteroides sp.]|nr:DUF4249 domain-containing protein [Bacteroides sp.]MCM1085648.1 DUF4249 domain-containing protein [Bacteroides sp.]